MIAQAARGAPRVIRFYFDYVSPNAYLAWTQLPALAERHGAVIEPVPVLFAGLLEAHGQLGPAEVPAKMRWMWKNTLRKAAVLGVELNVPAFHPFNPLLALRISSSLVPDAQRRLIDALFNAVWVRGLHVAEPAVVENIVNEMRLDGAALVAESQQAARKTALREQTDQAISGGVFGVPTMAVGDELFWGYDDLIFLERFLEGTDVIGREKWEDSALPQASAVRNRTP
ncbi:MAG TPA: 2-hydroxychromene-2-carboxylate isomerase [Burkholderiaceae bacterium]|nr:2-hydroxychromene-2-carboxylate isomerase [Burkholderiaceae bacterium]